MEGSLSLGGFLIRTQILSHTTLRIPAIGHSCNRLLCHSPAILHGSVCVRKASPFGDKCLPPVVVILLERTPHPPSFCHMWWQFALAYVEARLSLHPCYLPDGYWSTMHQNHLAHLNYGDRHPTAFQTHIQHLVSSRGYEDWAPGCLTLSVLASSLGPSFSPSYVTIHKGAKPFWTSPIPRFPSWGIHQILKVLRMLEPVASCIPQNWFA